MPSLPAFAGEPPLRLDLSFRAVRTNAPVLAQATLSLGEGRLLEGRLEVAVKCLDRVVVTCRTHDIALAPGAGDKSFLFLIPIPWSVLRDRTVEVYPRFITERGVIRLPMTMPALPEPNERRALAAVVLPRDNVAEERDKMLSSLPLEAFRPKLPEGSHRGLFTQRADFTPDELPAQPLAYCAFDLLVLTGRGFAALRGDQLDAIAHWARAGGSVAIEPRGTLTARQAQFLNELADRDTPLFRLDAAGRLLPTEPPQVSGPCAAHLLRPCLGRAAVITTHPPREHDYKACPQWRAILAFLWKVRQEQLPSILKDGKWRSDLEKDAVSSYYDDDITNWKGAGSAAPGDAELETRLAPGAFDDLSQIARDLMPKDVQRISFAGIVLVLVLFILLIGPADYFLLGLIRMRKLTWLLLPIVAALFTYFMVRLSEYYMGMVDRRRAVVIVDVDRKGQPVRQVRFELLFPGAERVVSVPLKSTLLHSVDCAGLTRRTEEYPYGVTRSYGPRYAPMELTEAGEAMPLSYEGSVLGQCAATHRVRQWSPVLYRSLSFEPPKRAADIQWGAVTIRDFQSAAARYEVPAKLFRGRSSSAGVFLFPGHDYYPLRGSLSGYPFLGASTIGRRDTLLRAFCCHPRFGLFAIVSQTSPAGAMHFEDLALLDQANPSEWLLVVVEEVGDEVYVYRRLYRGET